MARRAFCYREYVAGWRRLASENDLDARTGRPLEYTGTPWWAVIEYWQDSGPSRSRVEADALRSIAAQARAIAGVKEEPTLVQRMAAEFRAVVKEALEEDRAARRADLPLRELHALRGETVIDIEGMRVLVPIKVA